MYIRMRASRILPKSLRFQQEKSAERWSKLVPALNLRWSSQHFRLKTQEFQAGDWCIPPTASCLYLQLLYHKWRFEVSLPISQQSASAVFSSAENRAQTSLVRWGQFRWRIFAGRWGQWNFHLSLVDKSTTLGRSNHVISKQSGESCWLNVPKKNV